MQPDLKRMGSWARYFTFAMKAAFEIALCIVAGAAFCLSAVAFLQLATMGYSPGGRLQKRRLQMWCSAHLLSNNKSFSVATLYLISFSTIDTKILLDLGWALFLSSSFIESCYDLGIILDWFVPLGYWSQYIAPPFVLGHRGSCKQYWAESCRLLLWGPGFSCIMLSL